MWGSDRPVVRLRYEYEDWYTAARALTSELDAEASAQVFGGTAQRFYRIPD